MTVAFGQRAAAALLRVDEVLSTAPEVADPPRPAARCPSTAGGAPVGGVRFHDVHFGYDPSAPVLRGFDLTIQPGEQRRAGRCDRQRQVDGRPPADALLRRPARVRSAWTASTSATCGWASCATRSGIVFEDTFLFNDSVSGNIAFARPDADAADVERAARLAGAHDFVLDAAGRLRHDHRRARLLAERRSAAAHRHRQGDPGRPARARARRRDQRCRPVEGARDPRGDGHGHARPHDHRHRPPAGHHRAGRHAWCWSTTDASPRTARTTSCWRPTSATARCWPRWSSR